MSVEREVGASGLETIEELLQTATSPNAGNDTVMAAARKLRTMILDAPTLDRLMAIVSDADAALPLRCGAIQVFGHHRPWRNLDLFHDDRVQHIPDKLTAIAMDTREDHTVREAVIPVVGWQYLSEKNAWESLLASKDAFLRREALYELLRAPDREALELLIRHLTTEQEEHIREALLWSVARHVQFFPIGLIMLSRAGGAIHLHTVTEACKTDLLTAARALLDADIKYFEVRETLLQYLFQEMDSEHLSCLLTLMQADSRQFAVRKLRDVEEPVADEVIRLLDESVQKHSNEDWTEEAAKLILHYWDRFELLRYKIRNVLGAWRPFSSRITNMAMGKDIYW